MDDPVQDATAALKGLLGISEKVEEKTPKPNKKKQKPPKQDVTNEEGQEKKTAPEKKEKKKRKPKKKKGTEENYAWSAFQSSPDASKLPIPAFSSPNNEKKTVVPPKDIPDTPSITKDDAEQEPETNMSATGVNLAALSSPQRPGMSPQPPQQQQPPPPQPRGGPPMYSPPPALPPGYITIQVQVPPNLPPTRQMVVNSPAGYPVQVVVPPQIPPGAVIPVSVPAMPLHMMPPPPHYNNQY